METFIVVAAAASSAVGIFCLLSFLATHRAELVSAYNVHQKGLAQQPGGMDVEVCEDIVELVEETVPPQPE